MRNIITGLLLTLMSTVGWSESWFRGDTDELFLLQPLEIQTDSWATCAAAFDAAALVQRAQGRENVATAFGDQGNGAELSIAMAEVMSFIQKSSDELKGKGNVGKEYAAGFNRAWTVGKLKMENMPAAKSTWIMAQQGCGNDGCLPEEPRYAANVCRSLEENAFRRNVKPATVRD